MYSDIDSSWDPNRIDPLKLYSYISLQLGSAIINPRNTYPGNINYQIEGISISSNKVFNVMDPSTGLFFSKTTQSPFVTTDIQTTTQILPTHNQDFVVDLAYSAETDSNNLELETIIKFKQFSEVTDIYFKESDQIITVRVLIDLAQYDYDLMNEIFNRAEFPLKDKFEKDRLIDFQYLYVSQQSEQIEHFGKYIFHR